MNKPFEPVKFDWTESSIKTIMNIANDRKNIDILMYLFCNYTKVDKISMMKELTPVLFCYDRGISGSIIEYLFGYICQSKGKYMIAFIRGVQLGLIDFEDFKVKSLNQQAKEIQIDFENVMVKINEMVKEVDFSVDLPEYVYIP